MGNKLENKIIIVTGGNGLLGKSIISRIKEEGAFCINLDVNHETSADFSTVKCDITNTNTVDESIENILNKFGKIDGLVNNAYPRTADWGNFFEDIKFDSWQKNIDYQLNSYFYITQKVVACMKNKNHGSIVNMASVYGIVGPDFSVYEGTEMTMPAAYAAIKGGIVNFTRYLSSYFGKNNIRVNAVSPGGVFNNQPNQFVENYIRKVPLQRMAKPDDISPAVVFLLSDDSSYITGQNIAIDGGWTAI
jgi:NAD(P)-dependent dehydrogenase (short-subunit alcohol dehydrogenase family)